MNLPKFVLSPALLFYLLFPSIGVSQKDSGKWLNLSADAALIVAKAVSHYEPERSGSRYSTNEISGNTSSYLPGCNLGVTSIWGKQNYFNFILGLSCSVTQSRYHYYYSYYTDYTNSGRLEKYDVDMNSRIFNLNGEIGCRVKLFGNLFLQQTALFHQNIETVRKETGTKGIYLLSNTTSSKIDEPVNLTKRFHDDGRVSVRFSLYYRIKTKKTSFYAFVFRNFGFKYKLPWWGAGISIPL
jgi:hypothetical protein